MGKYNLSEEDAQRISKEFEKLRFEVRRKGLLDGETPFFLQKLLECLMIISLAVVLQIKGYYIPSALCMGLAWQQLGWMIHEYCHHQHFKVCVLKTCNQITHTSKKLVYLLTSTI